MVELSTYKSIFGDLDLQKRWLLKRLILQAVFIGFSTSFFIVGAYDLILKSLLIRELPYAYLVAGVGGIFIVKIFKRIQRDYGTSYAHRILVFAFILLMLIMFYSEMAKVVFVNKKAVAILGFACILPFVNIFNLNMSNSCYQLLGAQIGKKWIINLSAVEAISAIIAFLSVPVVIYLVVEINYLFVVAVLFILPLIFLNIFDYLRRSGSKSTYSLSSKINLNKLKQIPFLKSILVASAISMIILYVVDFAYLISITSLSKINNWKTFEIITGFFATVKMGEIIGFFFSSKLIKSFGTKQSLRIYSLCIFILSLITILVYFFWGINVGTLFILILCIKWIETVFRKVIDAPSNRIMLHVATPEEKSGLQSALEGSIGQMSAVISALLLWVLVNLNIELDILKNELAVLLLVAIVGASIYWIIKINQISKYYQIRITNFLNDRSVASAEVTDQLDKKENELQGTLLSSNEVIRKLWSSSLLSQIDGVQNLNVDDINFDDILEMGLASPIMLKSDILGLYHKDQVAIHEKSETKNNVLLLNLGESLVWIDLTIEDIKGHTLTEYYLYVSLIQTRKLLIKQLFTVLSWDYSPSEMEVISKLIFNENADEDDTQFAMELLDNILPSLIKPYLVPLFENNPIEVKVEKWRYFIPALQLSIDDRLKDIAMRDFSQLPISVKFWALRILNQRKHHHEYLQAFETSTILCLSAAILPKVSTMGNMIELFEKSLDFKNPKEVFAKTELFCDWINNYSNYNIKGTKIVKADFEKYIESNLSKVLPYSLD
jgi:hypothetical protein